MTTLLAALASQHPSARDPVDANFAEIAALAGAGRQHRIARQPDPTQTKTLAVVLDGDPQRHFGYALDSLQQARLVILKQALVRDHAADRFTSPMLAAVGARLRVATTGQLGLPASHHEEKFTVVSMQNLKKSIPPMSAVKQ